MMPPAPDPDRDLDRQPPGPPAPDDPLRRVNPLVPLDSELEFSAIRAQGAGGQNVNKVSNAVHLRFNVPTSHLPEAVKSRLLALGDQRITRDGVVVIKAQAYRSLEMNRQEALERLCALIADAAHVPKARRATKPTRGSQRRRVEAKVQRGQTKALRGKVSGD